MMLYRNVLGASLMHSQGRPLLSIAARCPVRTRTPHTSSLAPAKVILCTTDQAQTPLFGATGPVPQRTRSSVLCDGPVSLASLSPAFRHSNGPVPGFQHYRSFATSATTDKAAHDDEYYMETIDRYWKLLQEGRRAARAGGTVRTGVLQLAQKAGLLSATRPDPDLPSELEHLVRACTNSKFLTDPALKHLLRHYACRTGTVFDQERYNNLVAFLQDPEIEELLRAADSLSNGMVEFPPARQSSAHSEQTSRLLASVETYLVDVEAIPLGVEDLYAFLADACNTYDAASNAPPIPSSELPLEPSSALRIVKGDDIDFTVTLNSPEAHITTVGTWSGLLSDVAGLKENVKDLTQDVEALWKENKALKEDTGELWKENKALKEDMGEVRKENKALKEDVGELVEADKVLRELRTDSE